MRGFPVFAANALPLSRSFSQPLPGAIRLAALWESAGAVNETQIRAAAKPEWDFMVE